MLICIGYVRIVKVFRRKKREVYSPIYKDVGKAQTPDKALKLDLKRET